MKKLALHNSFNSLFLVSLIALTFSVQSGATDIDNLGGNKDLIRRAKSLNPNNKISIVQKRVVDLNNRVEASFGYSYNSGGDPYVDSQSLGVDLAFHFNPRWAFGVRYQEHYNTLNSEGERVYGEANTRAAAGQTFVRPDVDYALNSTMGYVTYAPIYGKLNLFNIGVSQFDMFVLAGAGQIKLESGSTSTWTSGVGAQIWFNNRITSKFELRYQSYEDQIYSGPRNINLTIGMASIGFML